MPLSVNQFEDVFSLNNKSSASKILNLNIDNENNEKLIVSYINKLLSSSKTRQNGLDLLNSILENFSHKVLSENALNWLQHCLIQQHGHDSLKELKLTTISNIIQNTHKDQEFTKKFISDHLYKISEHCINSTVDINETEAALKCLTICMIYYRSACTPQKNKIEAFLIRFLDSPCENLVNEAGIAFHYLQQVGNAGPDGVNHMNNFSTQFSKLIVTVHTLFDTLFENITEIDSSQRDGDIGFAFELLPCFDSQKILEITARRIDNCLSYMEIMMTKKFTSFKTVKLTQILSVIKRGIAVHKCLSEENLPLQTYYFSTILHSVQIHLLQILYIVIIWLRLRILPFSYTISKILIDCLKRTHNCDCFKVDIIYQETVYKTLGVLFQIMKTAVQADYQTKLLECIFKDITAQKNKVTLTITNTNKNKSNKSKQKEINNRIMGVNQDIGKRQSAHAKIHQQNSCKLALVALKQLIISTSLKVNNNTLIDLYTTVLNAISDVQQNSSSSLYEKQECQILLYEVLVSFYEQDNVKILPPIQKTLYLLNNGLKSNNFKVVSICEQGISMLEKLCQPICPSLNLPPEENNVNLISENLQQNGMIDHQHFPQVENVEHENFNEKPINIIDVQIVKPANNIEDAVTENGLVNDNNEIKEDDIIQLSSPEKLSEHEDDEDVAMDEIHNNSKMLEDVIDLVDQDEPSEKRMKITSQELNKEFEIFESQILDEDFGFVDEVRDD